MKTKLRRILDHITRSWEDEPEPPHPRMRILPPFALELLLYLMAGGILYQLGLYLYHSI